MKTISTAGAPKAIGPYSQAIVANGLVFTAGQIALRPDGTFVSGSIAEQAEQAIQNLAAVLEAAGSSLDKTVKTTVFLADIADFPAMNKVYAKHFTSKPARSTVAVKTLPKGALVEIDAVAVVE